MYTSVLGEYFFLLTKSSSWWVFKALLWQQMAYQRKKIVLFRNVEGHY